MTRQLLLWGKENLSNHNCQHILVLSYRRTEFKDIIRMQVEAMFQRFEPLDRLLNPFVQEALAAAVRKRRILHHIPSTTETLYNDYVVPIDRDATKGMVSILKKKNLEMQHWPLMVSLWCLRFG